MSIQSQPAATQRFRAVRSSVVPHSAVGFEQSLAQASLRRVEEKEFLFAEGDATSHVYRIETVRSPSTGFWLMAVVRSWASPTRETSSGSASKTSMP